MTSSSTTTTLVSITTTSTNPANVIHFAATMRLTPDDNALARCFCSKLCSAGSSAGDTFDIVTLREALTKVSDVNKNVCLACAAVLMNIAGDVIMEREQQRRHRKDKKLEKAEKVENV